MESFLTGVGSGAQIKVVENAELTIENGKFVAGNKNDINSRLFYIAGKLIINDATFSTERFKSVTHYDNYMIFLDSNSECVINNGDFTNAETLIKIGEVPVWNGKDYNDNIFFNKCRLTINGGKFSCLDESAIKIYAFYPYSENKEIVTPKIKLNNCDIKSKNSAIIFYGGCIEEEFRKEKTEILTILGGTYTCSEQSIGAPIEIQTEHSDISTYFNPNDLVLKGGTFESLNNTKGALGLIGPRKR